MIIATAGHVDHGKTTLLQALTGADGDRLPEEKRRGMTIDLGYAYLPLPDGQILGFIDVPGHEKFLANMLAGVGGIQHALLVVACDDGVMPQTREHLTILRLAGTPALTVVLTKSDRVSREQIEAVRQQTLAELEAQEWPDVTLFVTAANNGSGITELRQHLMELPQTQSGQYHRFRLAIDRAFTIKGSGLVVTGTALSGEVRVGDSLWLTGCNQPVRVRSLHAQNTPAETAGAGQRIALNISGDIDKQQVERGNWLLSEKPPEPTDRILATLYSHSPLRHWQPVHLHHAASHITGRISLLQDSVSIPDGNTPTNSNTLVELVFDQPLLLAENDRLIVRDISARETLGGARVLVLTPPRRGKRQPAYLDRLNALSQASSDLQVLNIRLSEGALSLANFAWARQLTREGLDALLTHFDGVIANDIALRQSSVEDFQQRLMDCLKLYHEQHSDQLGLGRARLRRMALLSEPEALVFVLIDRMLAEGQLINTRGWLHLPEHGLAFTPEQQLIWQKMEPLFAGDPLWVRDLANLSGLDENQTRSILRKAAQLGLVVAIIKDRYFLNARLREFADLIRSLQVTHGSTSAADFRDQLGVGRKLAIQILEFFDRSGFTRRRGNDHILRDSALFSD